MNGCLSVECSKRADVVARNEGDPPKVASRRSPPRCRRARRRGSSDAYVHPAMEGLDNQPCVSQRLKMYESPLSHKITGSRAVPSIGMITGRRHQVTAPIDRRGASSAALSHPLTGQASDIVADCLGCGAGARVLGNAAVASTT